MQEVLPFTSLYNSTLSTIRHMRAFRGGSEAGGVKITMQVNVYSPSMSSPSYTHVLDWPRGCVRGGQGVVISQTGFER